jgi:hypothetical protein
MGILELIQQKSFLGREFLTWLWWRAERDNRIETGRDATFELEIQGPIHLDAQYGDARATSLKGDSPATSPEAATSLVQGKKMKRMKFRMEKDQLDWTVTLDGENFNITGLSIPDPGRLPFKDRISLRMEMVIHFEEVLQSIFELFLESRLDDKLWDPELLAIQEWVRQKAGS